MSGRLNQRASASVYQFTHAANKQGEIHAEREEMSCKDVFRSHEIKPLSAIQGTH